MRHPDELSDFLLKKSFKINSQNIKIKDCGGRILAADVFADFDSPPFDKSAMDGYAYNTSDNTNNYNIAGTIPAGEIAFQQLTKGACIKIMTGAMLPQRADAVIPVENTRINNGQMQIIKKSGRDNICRQGEDIKKGDKILFEGTLITSKEIAILASFGYDRISVSRRPVVSVITTGSELKNPGQKLTPGAIYNSNGPQLRAQLKAIQVDGLDFGIIKDKKKDLKKNILKALKKSEILLLTGGVSMGDYDYVPNILREIGCSLDFEKIALKPGKPTVCATLGQKLIFGIPGNPVSGFVIFELFIKPFIYKMMGHEYIYQEVKAELADNIERTKANRVEYRPVIYSRGIAAEVSYHGSGHLHALYKANALIRIEQGIHQLKKGSKVIVRFI